MPCRRSCTSRCTLLGMKQARSCNDFLVGDPIPLQLVGDQQAPPSLVLRSTLSSAIVIYSYLPGFH